MEDALDRLDELAEKYEREAANKREKLKRLALEIEELEKKRDSLRISAGVLRESISADESGEGSSDRVTGAYLKGKVERLLAASDGPLHHSKLAKQLNPDGGEADHKKLRVHLYNLEKKYPDVFKMERGCLKLIGNTRGTEQAPGAVPYEAEEPPDFEDLPDFGEARPATKDDLPF